MNTITKGMKKQDRFETLYQARLQVVKLLKEGRSNKEIAALLDVSKSHVSKIKCDYEHNGLAALRIYEHGKPWGEEGRKIQPEEIKLTRL